MDELKLKFGNEIATLVDGVTKISKMKTQSDIKNQAENFRKLILAVSKDIRVLLVKLADRLHNMRTITFVPSEEKRKRIALETMEIYAPLAGRLGMQSFRDELEDLSFQILNKAAYTSIKNRVDYLKSSSSNLTEKINIQIVTLLKDENISCEVLEEKKRFILFGIKCKERKLLLDSYQIYLLIELLPKIKKTAIRLWVLFILNGQWFLDLSKIIFQHLK
jgi:(p)ppGpp synthase/HD superfamily hydrolase